MLSPEYRKYLIALVIQQRRLYGCFTVCNSRHFKREAFGFFSSQLIITIIWGFFYYFAFLLLPFFFLFFSLCSSFYFTSVFASEKGNRKWCVVRRFQKKKKYFLAIIEEGNNYYAPWFQYYLYTTIYLKIYMDYIYWYRDTCTHRDTFVESTHSTSLYTISKV